MNKISSFHNSCPWKICSIFPPDKTPNREQQSRQDHPKVALKWLPPGTEGTKPWDGSRGATGCNRWRNIINALSTTAGEEGKYVTSPLALTEMEASFFSFYILKRSDWMVVFFAWASLFQMFSVVSFPDGRLKYIPDPQKVSVIIEACLGLLKL